MANVKYKGEGGLKWNGPSGKTYTITSFGTTNIDDERDLKQLDKLGDFIITPPITPQGVEVITVNVPEDKPAEPDKATRRGRKKKED